MIFINHLPAAQWSLLTLRSWGFADSAEVFVLLAGMAAAFAYSRYFDQREHSIGALAVLSRIWTLYLTHLMLFLVVGALCIFGAERLNDITYLETLGFDVFLQAPATFLRHVLTLSFLPGYLDILPLYIVLLALLPAIFVLERQHWALPLLVSLAFYIAAQILPLNLPNTRTAKEWFFNPAAWQLLFVIGFTLARRIQSGEGFGFLERRLLAQCITAVALLFVVVAAVIAAPWREIPGYENTILVNPGQLGAWSKTDLHPVRLADILAKLWLAGVFVPRASRWLLSRPAQFFTVMGKHSLEVFSLLTVLALAGSIIITAQGFSAWLIATFVLGGTLAMGLLARAIEWRSNRLAQLSRKGTRGDAAQTLPASEAAGSADRPEAVAQDGAIAAGKHA